jgi:hypothetical protein
MIWRLSALIIMLTEDVGGLPGLYLACFEVDRKTRTKVVEHRNVAGSFVHSFRGDLYTSYYELSATDAAASLITTLE